ncbi:MAG: SWIM zinc finger family protein [Myxococcota bacterium]
MNAWWSRQLVELMEAPGLERELRRGRAYAEEGRIASLQVASGRASALIQGTRPRPYRATISVMPLSDLRWQEIVVQTVDAPALWSALIGGGLPRVARDWRLVPREPIELEISCSCPVRDLFCKHTAAVVFELASRSATDPFLLTAWRGRSRPQLERMRAMVQGPCGEVA